MEQNKKEKRSVFGHGPYIIGVIVILAAIGIYLNLNGYLNEGIVTGDLQLIFKIFGVLIIIFNVILYFSTIFNRNTVENIKDNKLVTNGSFSIVRHPIYSALTGITVGILLLFHNLWFFLWFIAFYIILKLLIPFEERKIEEEFKEEYAIYKKQVNQVIPFFKRK